MSAVFVLEFKSILPCQILILGGKHLAMFVAFAGLKLSI